DTTKTFIINVCAVAIALQLLGLWGAYKEHYYTCITYGVLISLIGCAAVLSALQSGYPLVWILTIWFFTSSFIALSFARRIRVRRLLELTTITYNMGQTRLILTAGTLVTASLYPPRPPSYVESEAMSTTYKTTAQGVKGRKFRNIKYTLMSCAGIAFVLTIIIMSTSLAALDDYYITNTWSTAKGIIGTIGAVSLVIQLLGLYGAHKEHYNFTMAYGIVSAILAGLCIVSALTGNSVGDWFLMIFFAICASVALQFAREIRRLLNPPLSPNVVYMNNNGQPPYVVPGAQVQSGPIYLTPVTIPGQTGPVYIQSQTGQVVTFPAPGAAYVGPADNPPTYRQSQEDISNMSVSAAPGGSDGIANQNVEERKVVFQALIITVGVLSILAQFGGLWGAYKDHYYISLSYGIGSILLAGLCIVSAIVGAGGIDWLLIIFFVICGSLGCQLSREIKRTNRMPVLNQTVYMNPGIQPNMVYQMPNTGQPAYMVQGGQVQTGPMYMSPTLTAVQTMPAQSGQIFVSSPQYPTSQVVAFPTPGPSYGGSSTSPPTYTQSQEDISRMSVNEQPSGAQGAPGGSNSYLNENIEERKTIPN
ncbi:unnamed protein product, partial [Oppiella nova]